MDTARSMNLLRHDISFKGLLYLFGLNSEGRKIVIQHVRFNGTEAYHEGPEKPLMSPNRNTIESSVIMIFSMIT